MSTGRTDKLLQPTSLEELQTHIHDAVQSGEALEVLGGGSKRFYGRPVAAARTLSVAGLRGIIDYQPHELILVARARPGETVALPEGGDVEVVARVQSITPLSKVRLLFNGRDVAEIPLAADRKSATFTNTLRVDESGWFHLRASGDPGERFPLDARYAQAFTNPVWVTVGGAPVRSREAAEYSVRWIDKLRRMAEEWPGWRSPQEEEHVYAQFDEARAIYRRLAEETDAIAKR